MCASRTSQADIKAIRIAAGGADAVLACDMVVAGSARSLAAIDRGKTLVFVNSHETLPGDFTHNPDFTLPTRRLLAAIAARSGRRADAGDRGDGGRDRASRRFDRDQHVHARARLSGRGHPGVGSRD